MNENHTNHYDGMKPGTRVLVWLLGIMAAGILLCVLLALLKIAVKAMVIIAAVLALLVIIGIVTYNGAKEKIEDHRLKRENDRLLKDRQADPSHSLDDSAN